jgi:hypothetical protein
MFGGVDLDVQKTGSRAMWYFLCQIPFDVFGVMGAVRRH